MRPERNNYHTLFRYLNHYIPTEIYCDAPNKRYPAIILLKTFFGSLYDVVNRE